MAATLKRMAKKGLVFPKRQGEIYYYAAPPFAHGILEHQVNRLDREMAQLYEDYMWEEKLPESLPTDEQAVATMPTRSIPVKTPVNVTRPIAPYEDVREIIMRQERIALAKCF